MIMIRERVLTKKLSGTLSLVLIGECSSLRVGEDDEHNMIYLHAQRADVSIQLKAEPCRVTGTAVAQGKRFC